MSEVLKRIIVAQTNNVLVEDLKILLRRRGDSIDLLAPQISDKGRSKRSLQEICNSTALDVLISNGNLKLYDENGNQLTGLDAKKATNISTLINQDTSNVDNENFVLKSGDTMTGNLVGKDFISTLGGEITRVDGEITQIVKSDGRTIVISRTLGLVSSITDGSRTWTYTRDGDGNVVSWTVT